MLGDEVREVELASVLFFFFFLMATQLVRS